MLGKVSGASGPSCFGMISSRIMQSPQGLGERISDGPPLSWRVRTSLNALLAFPLGLFVTLFGRIGIASYLENNPLSSRLWRTIFLRWLGIKLPPSETLRIASKTEGCKGVGASIPLFSRENRNWPWIQLTLQGIASALEPTSLLLRWGVCFLAGCSCRAFLVCWLPSFRHCIMFYIMAYFHSYSS